VPICVSDPVHSGGGVNTVVNAVSYNFGSICKNVQATARVVDGVTLGDVVSEVVVEVLAGIGLRSFVQDEEGNGSVVADERTHCAMGV
jgi:hypothetical protein